SFFNEQEGKAVQQLFQDSTLIPSLQMMHAEIRMGMLDLSPERLEVIQRLNRAGIPVVAWLLLPKEKGYWFHSGNAREAFERYQEVKNWAAASGIHFSGIGLDLELDMNDLILFQTNKWKLLGKLIGRLYAKEEFMAAKKAYEQLIDTIRKDGFPIESYYIPIIRYETARGQTALQQMSGFMDLKTDKDIPMLYTSFMGDPYGTLKVLAIDEKLETVALGSTGGGFDPTMKSMTWEALEYDLRLAATSARELHIFCLEAAVEKGFIQKMSHFQYDLPVKAYPEQIAQVKSRIHGILLLSNIFSHPNWLIFGLFVLLLGLLYGLFVLTRWVVRRLTSTKTGSVKKR
ncbi:MAG: hypothetical protein LWW85_12465, partial [Marinilabiliales bacterium]|nr:hypothetical protein [Marinilabiliales bacterium]